MFRRVEALLESVPDPTEGRSGSSMTNLGRHSSISGARGTSAFSWRKRRSESYVPPAEALADRPVARRAQRAIGHSRRARHAQRKMRCSSSGTAMYVRGARTFDEMTNVSKALRIGARQSTATRDQAGRSSPSRFPRTARANGLLRLPKRQHRRNSPHEVECVYIPETDREHALISLGRSAARSNCSHSACRHAAASCATSPPARSSAR